MGVLKTITSARTQRVEARQARKTTVRTARQEERTERATARQAQRQASTAAKAAGGKWDPASVAARQSAFAQLGAAGAQLAGSAFMAGAGMPPVVSQAGEILGALDVSQVGQVLGGLGIGTSSGSGAAPSWTDYPAPGVEVEPPIQPESSGVGAWIQENPLLALGLVAGAAYLITSRKG